MQEARKAVFHAVRSRLISCTNLTNIIPSNNIRPSSMDVKSTFPAIRIRVVANEGRNLRSFLEGDIFLGIYTESSQPSAFLASSNQYVVSLMVTRVSALTTSNVAFSRIYEDFCDYPIFDEESGLRYLSSRYHFTAQIRK